MFEAGRLKDFEENWRNLTSDPDILNIALHCDIEFETEVPLQRNIQFQKFNQHEEFVIDAEIEKLLEMKVIEEVSFTPGQFISPIFTRPKKDGDYRMILNLKELNKYIKYYHFKLDTFETTLHLIKPDCFMASVDLRHAYYSVPMAQSVRKYLRFMWKGKIFEYCSLPNGIACAPRYFTKLLKPVFSKLRQMGHTNSGYIDDSLLVADTEEQCYENIKDTVHVMEGVGFIIHQNKSVLVPTQDIGFLGNRINSKQMIVYLPEEKKQHIKEECLKLSKNDVAKIREVARVIGLIISTFSAVEYGALHYRELESQKIIALKKNPGNFEAIMSVTAPMKAELSWWIDNVETQIRNISHGNADLVLVTDASLSGWGAHCKNQKIGGRWTVHEAGHHINCLEMLAIFYGLKSFCKDCSCIHVQVKTDSTCAKAYINSMGGIKSSECNDMAKKIWSWCIERKIWISAEHIPGSENLADFESRNYKENTEWKLDSTIVSQIFEIWGTPEIDMFATRLNTQLERFAAWHPDPEAEIINAFSCDWSKYYFYAFPCFSLIPRCLAKLRHDGGECILIAPVWTSQSWFPTLMEMMTDIPHLLPKRENLLTLPGTRKIHPLHKKMTLMACRLSGKLSRVEKFLKEQPTSLWPLGDMGHRSNTQPTLKDGFSTVIKGKLINFKQM